LRQSQVALTLAQESAHAHSQVFALVHATFLHHLRREGQAARRRAEEGVALATEQGFVLWVAYATILRGRGLVELGQREEAIAQIREVRAGYRGMGAVLECPSFVSLRAEVLAQRGQIEEEITLVALRFRKVDNYNSLFN